MNQKKKTVTQTKLTRALQNLVRENVRMEECIDKLTFKVNSLELVLTTLVQYYKDIKDLEEQILKGLK